jgi:hypothetical protein
MVNANFNFLLLKELLDISALAAAVKVCADTLTVSRLVLEPRVPSVESVLKFYGKE